ncbi:MAG TPA: hypothetical protein GX706_03470 [Candidatus Moranbacteria bacterium]|nr:hypothetical protein [Candidatus Moranbacteria bacterium]
MILGIKELHRLVKEQGLVEDLCERELNNPEGAGFDLRLGEVFELSGDGFLGVEERETPEAKSIARYNPEKVDDENYFVFESGKYYLIKTIEKVNLPVDLSGVIFPRTTMFRSGLGLFNGVVQPGYQGELTFGVCNFGPAKVKISFGARIVHITFQEVLGEGNQYRGQWQGGRVSTDGKEVQV